MIAPDVIVCSSFGRRAAAIAGALVTGVPGPTQPGHEERRVWMQVAPEAAATLDDLRSRYPSAGFVVLIEGPVDGLAAALDGGAETDPRGWAGGWRRNATALLSLILEEPSRTIALTVNDALAYPERFLHAIGEHVGVMPWPPAELASLSRTAVDPLCVALACATVVTDTALRRCASELESACAWLGDDMPPIIDAVGEPPDVVAAGRTIRELRETRDILQRMQAERIDDRRRWEQVIDSANIETRALSERLAATEAALRDQLSQAIAQHDAKSEEMRVARSESELLVMQLHRVQQDLEEQFVARRKAEAQLQAALEATPPVAPSPSVADREVGTAREECELLVMQLHRVQADLEATFVARREAETRLQQLRAECDEVRRALAERDVAIAAMSAELGTKGFKTASGQAEVEQLKRQIAAQVEREARTVGRLRDDLAALLARTESAPSPVGFVRIRFDEPAVLEEVSERPYRGLTLLLRGLSMGERAMPETRVRLVEHGGNPGLVVFRDSDGPALLDAWTESGREGGRPFTLLVPVDANCRPMFDALSRRDWRFLLTLTARLQHHSFGESVRSPAFWQALARRLHESLLELPPRFRFDEASTVPSPEYGMRAFDFTLTDIAFGSRRLDSLRVRWQAFDTGARLWLMVDPRSGPPLPSWPDDVSGNSPPALEFDFRSDPEAAPARERFAALADPDRNFVIALLRAWPDVLRRCTHDHEDYAALAEAAAATCRQLVAFAGPPQSDAEVSRLADRAKRLLRAGMSLPIR
jgi:hypothetical protein